MLCDPSALEKQLRRRGKRVATRRAIQDEFLVQLASKGFKPGPNSKESWGIQLAVFKAVNKTRYSEGYLETSRETVRTWTDKVRKNGYKPTPLLSDYSGSSQNARKLSAADQRKIRAEVYKKELKCDEVVTIYSDEKQTHISVSKSTVRRILKRKFEDEPSMHPAVPKPMRIGGNTAHHARCRFTEAK